MPERRNILWISLEDTSPRFGCYGDEVARTPNLDRFAGEGCRFPNAFSVAGVCAPSRCAVITGMYPTSIGSHHMRTSHRNENVPELPTPYSVCPPPPVKCFTEYLRGLGYFCTNNQKTDYQFDPPLTAWDELGPEAHWHHRPDGAPFFAVFNPTVTHESGMWPEKRRETGLTTDPDAVSLPPYLPDTRKCREALAQHYDNLELADRRVGELLAEIETDGLSDNTLVFIWSDHGEGLPRGKRWPYDAGIRIPLIVKGHPALVPGSVSDQLVSLIDLGPTMLSLAGAQIPRHMQGRPFLGPQCRRRDYIYASRDRHDEFYDRVRAVRDRRYKYMRHYHPELPYLPWNPYRNRHPVMQEMWRLYAGGELTGPERLLFEPRPVEELYDTEADPFEMVNLAGDADHQAILERMRQALDEWIAEVGDLGEIAEEMMVAAWHPGGQQPTTAPVQTIVLGADHPGREPVTEAQLEMDCLVQLYSATQGASIAWRLEPANDPGGAEAADGDDAHWQLYTQPLKLPEGLWYLHTRAVRIGYHESEERRVALAVRRR
ncbi:MAG: sulfatase [Candidatus Latescibacterota bacterium]|nr:sulfatase [Candidatus Latescibacterota bacterium]